MELLQGNVIIYSRKSLGKTTRAKDIIENGNFEKIFVISKYNEYNFDNVEYILNEYINESLYDSIKKIESEISYNNLLIIDDFHPLVLSDKLDNIKDDSYDDIYVDIYDDTCKDNYKELLCHIIDRNTNSLKTIFIISDIKDFPDIFKHRCNTMLTYF